MNYHTLEHVASNRSMRRFGKPVVTRQQIRAQERDVDLKREYRNYKRLGVPFGFDEVNMSQSIKQFTTGTRGATANTTSAAVTAEGATSIALAFLSHQHPRIGNYHHTG